MIWAIQIRSLKRKRRDLEPERKKYHVVTLMVALPISTGPQKRDILSISRLYTRTTLFAQGALQFLPNINKHKLKSTSMGRLTLCRSFAKNSRLLLIRICAESRRLIRWMEKVSFRYFDSDSQEIAMYINHSENKKRSAFSSSCATYVTPNQMRFVMKWLMRTNSLKKSKNDSERVTKKVIAAIPRDVIITGPLRMDIWTILSRNTMKLSCVQVALKSSRIISISKTKTIKVARHTQCQRNAKISNLLPQLTDYELPFFGSYSEHEWTKSPLKMDVGNVNSKHLILALKFKSNLDSCDDESDDLEGDGMFNFGKESIERDYSSDAAVEVNPSTQEDYFVVASVGKEHSSGEKDIVRKDETKDEEEDARRLTLAKEWIDSHHNDAVELTDVLSNFLDISMKLTEEIMAKLVDEEVISRAGGDTCTIRKIQGVESHLREERDAQETHDFKIMKKKDEVCMYMKALYHALPMDYVTLPKLHAKLNGEAKQATVHKLIDQMARDEYLKDKITGLLGKCVVCLDLTAKKLAKLQIALENNSSEMEIEEPQNRPGGLDHLKKGRDHINISICGGLRSFGSDLTRTPGKPQIQQYASHRSEPTTEMKQEQGKKPNSKHEREIQNQLMFEQPAPSWESIVSGNERTYSDGGNTRCFSQGQEPLLQYVKRQKFQVATVD